MCGKMLEICGGTGSSNQLLGNQRWLGRQESTPARREEPTETIPKRIYTQALFPPPLRGGDLRSYTYFSYTKLPFGTPGSPLPRAPAACRHQIGNVLGFIARAKMSLQVAAQSEACGESTGTRPPGHCVAPLAEGMAGGGPPGHYQSRVPDTPGSESPPYARFLQCHWTPGSLA